LNLKIIISIRPLRRDRLKQGPGGGGEIRKVNRPLSLGGKEGFPEEKCRKIIFLFWKLSTKE